MKRSFLDKIIGRFRDKPHDRPDDVVEVEDLLESPSETLVETKEKGVEEIVVTPVKATEIGPQGASASIVKRSEVERETQPGSAIQLSRGFNQLAGTMRQMVHKLTAQNLRQMEVVEKLSGLPDALEANRQATSDMGDKIAGRIDELQFEMQRQHCTAIELTRSMKAIPHVLNVIEDIPEATKSQIEILDRIQKLMEKNADADVKTDLNKLEDAFNKTQEQISQQAEAQADSLKGYAATLEAVEELKKSNDAKAEEMRILKQTMEAERKDRERREAEADKTRKAEMEDRKKRESGMKKVLAGSAVFLVVLVGLIIVATSMMVSDLKDSSITAGWDEAEKSAGDKARLEAELEDRQERIDEIQGRIQDLEHKLSDASANERAGIDQKIDELREELLAQREGSNQTPN